MITLVNPSPRNSASGVGRFARAFRGKVFSLAAASLACSVCMQAQTAHFGYALSTLGSGFSNPTGTAVDSQGNLFVTDEGTAAVYELTAASGYSTVITLTTQFTIPTGIAVDANDNVFVTDQGVGGVYELLAAGGYTTVNTLGTGFGNPNGVAVDASGNVFFSDTLNNAVKEMLAVSGSIPANPTINTLAGSYNYPTTVVVDSSGNVFVADLFNSAIKEILAAGGYTTVNTLGSGFSYPVGVAVDASDNVYVADSGNDAIKEILASGGYSTVNTLTSGLPYPTGVAVSSAGNVFIANYSGSSVNELTLYGGVVFGARPVATTTPQTIPITFVFDTGGTIGLPAVLTQGATGLDFTDAGTGTCTTNGTSHSYSAGDTCTVNVTFTPAFPYQRPGAVVLLGSSSTPIATAYISGIGIAPQAGFFPGTQSLVDNSGFSGASGVTVDGKGNVYIADEYSNGVYKDTLSAGSYTQSPFGTGFNAPFGMAVDGAGNIYIADAGNNQVVVERPTGSTYTPTTVGSGFALPRGVAVDGAGNIYVADTANNQIVKETLVNGAYTQSTIDTNVNGPYGIAVDTAGAVYIGDTQNNQVTKVTPNPDGTYSAPTYVVPPAGNIYPYGVAVDGAGNVYYADPLNDRVLKESPVAGGGYTETSVGTNLVSPFGVWVDDSGVVYIADSTQVVKVDPSASALTFASTVAGSTSSDTPQVITLLNIGNATLTLPAPSSGNNPFVSTNFTLDPSPTGACPTVAAGGTAGTLTASSSCTLSLGFHPLVAGTLVGSLTLQDTSLNAPGPAYATQTIALSGTATPAPLAASTTIASTMLTQGHAAPAFTPVSASGGTGTLTYTVAPALPAGLVFSSSTGMVSGTPTALNATTTYTVTITDTNSGTASATFSLTVNSAVSASTSIASTGLTQGHLATTFTPITATGGTGTLTYSVSPALPAGLVFSSSTGAVSGTSTALAPATTFTVTVTDTNSATATASFSLTVNSAVSASTSLASAALTQGHSASTFTPVTATGGTGALTYSVSPALPAGLTFTSSTGAVSGTPTALATASTYTVTVTDTNYATSTATFSLTVNSAVSVSTSIASTVLAPGVAASAFTPVTASGGTGALTYGVAPALPAGLVFAPSTGAVSGTPMAPAGAATYTVTVTDANGATGTATFSLAVNSAIITSTTLTSSNLTPTYGAAVVLSAAVTPAPADTPPGTASFFSGNTLLGTASLNASGVATLSISLPLGPNSITAVYSGSPRYGGSTSTAVSISDRTGTSVTFSASPTTQLYNNPIVLTAQATSPTAGTLTGMVNFLDGTTVIATVPIGANGRATYSTTSLADGSHSLTAAYSGDGNFLPSGSTGAAVAITVADVNLNLGGDQNQSAVPGAAVAYTFPLSPLVTPTFVYDVHLTATGLPPGATYTFSPAVIPAGSASMPVTLTVQTAKGVALLSHPAEPGQNSSGGLAAVAFGLLLPLLGAKPVRKRLKAWPKPLVMLLCIALSVGAVVGLSGCGSGGFYGPTATSGKYTITVTASSADLVRTSTVQLTIQ